MTKKKRKNLPLIKDDALLTDDDELFIAVAYRAPSHHSFIIVGAYNKKTKQSQLLSAIGKYFDTDKTEIYCGVMDAFFRNVPCKLYEENFLYTPEDFEITYKAYMLSPDQYEDYLATLYGCERSEYLGSYYLADKQPDEKIRKYQYGKMGFEVKVPESSINNHVKTIGIFNTCRHTAVDFLKTSFTRSITNVSNWFLSKLPNIATINAGKIHQPLFILPLPPDNRLDKHRFYVLSHIYKQLESISKHYQNNETTYDKFEQLKSLYVDLDNRKQFTSIADLFKTVESWETHNKKLIDTKRAFSIFRTTATRDMLNDIFNYQTRVFHC